MKSPLNWFFGVLVVIFLAIGLVDPIVGPVIMGLVFVVVTSFAIWLLYGLDSFVRGFKSRTFERAHTEVEN